MAQYVKIYSSNLCVISSYQMKMFRGFLEEKLKNSVKYLVHPLMSYIFFGSIVLIEGLPTTIVQLNFP